MSGIHAQRLRAQLKGNKISQKKAAEALGVSLYRFRNFLEFGYYPCGLEDKLVNLFPETNKQYWMEEIKTEQIDELFNSLYAIGQKYLKSAEKFSSKFLEK